MPAGRPPDYDKEYHPETAYNLALLGMTDKEISEELGIAKSTLNKWKKDHREFSDSLTRGKRLADSKVARSLFERACGYEHPETKFFVVKKTKFKEEIEERETIARYPPDTKAAAIWLSNRTRNWRERAGDAPKQASDVPNPTTRGLSFTIIDPNTQEEQFLDIGGTDEETI